MTISAALVDAGVTWMGSDSAATTMDGDREVLKNPKVFAKRDTKGTLWLIGWSGDYRLGQLVEHALILPNVLNGLNGNPLLGFLVNEFVKDYRRCLRENGAMAENQKNHREKAPGELIVGINGEIFTVSKYFDIYSPISPYTAIGSGSATAFGALGATKGLMGPEERILTALELAQEYSASVSDPFITINSKGAEESVRYIRSRRKPKNKR
jgi:hypothetical protein